MTKEQENRRDEVSNEYRLHYDTNDFKRSIQNTFNEGYNAGFEEGERIGISKVIDVLKNKMNNDGYIDIWTEWLEKHFADVLKEEK